MKAFVYIVLIALVLWTGFAWERAWAPAPLAVSPPQEEGAAAPAQETPPAQTPEVETAPVVSQPGPLISSQPAPPKPQVPTVAPELVEYTEEYVEQLEQAIHDRINAERTGEGLGLLEYDDVLAEVAAFHSTDMATNNYFAHEDEEGCDSACRLTSVGYPWRVVGENLFLLKSTHRYSVADASAIIVAGWMGSDGHRKNVLEKRFTHEGVGVVVLGDSVYATELLARPR